MTPGFILSTATTTITSLRTTTGSIGPWACKSYDLLSWTNAAYHCPAYNGQVSDDLNGGPEFALGSYSYNLWGAGEPTWTTFGLGVSGGEENGYGDLSAHTDAQVVAAPSQTYAIMDTQEVLPNADVSSVPNYTNNGVSLGSGWSGADYTGCLTTGYDIGPTPYSLTDFLQRFPKQHDQYFNVVFCDAHVANVRIADLFNPMTTARNWNVDYQPHPELWDR